MRRHQAGSQIQPDTAVYCECPQGKSGSVRIAVVTAIAAALTLGYFAPVSHIPDIGNGNRVLQVHAEELTSDGHPYDPVDEAARQEEPIQSNAISNWPQGPVISAGSAILMDVNTGTVLYAKNIHERMYPASTTKLLTCLIAAENLDLNDTVTFSEEAVNSVPADGSSIGMDVGETITVEQCLYGILVGSANECANAIAEKVAGSIPAFVDLMNQRAQELGCTDSNFANANGLFDENHYTSAHDLCLIGKAFFQNDILINIGCTPTYHFEATATQPDDFWIVNKHGLINGDYQYDGILGGKTGYTSQSKETLVTGCEQNGMRLVCVVMKEDSPKQFEDTISLFDYGYSSFTRVNAAENDTRYTVAPAGFMNGGEDLLGSSTPALTIADGSYVDVPSTTTFADLTSTIGTDNLITYTMNNEPADDDTNAVLGTARLQMTQNAGNDSTAAASSADTSGETADAASNSVSTPDAADSAQDSSAAAGSTVQNTSDASSSGLAGRLVARLGQIRNKIAASYYTEGLNGTIYINIITLAITAAAIALAIVLIVLIVRIHRSIRRSHQRQMRQRVRQNNRSTRYRRGEGRGDDYIDYYQYDRPDHFSDEDDDSWYR